MIINCLVEACSGMQESRVQGVSWGTVSVWSVLLIGNVCRAWVFRLPAEATESTSVPEPCPL